VLITSRMVLAGLPSKRLVLDPLPPDQAIGLLARIIGRDRVDAEFPAADRLCRFCEGLPLALRIVGARLVSRPHWTLARLVARLSDEDQRLDELSYGGRTLRAGLVRSYRSLDLPDQAFFRLLGPVEPDVFPATAERLLSRAPAGTEDALDRLVDAGLFGTGVDRLTGQRVYRRSELVRLYAREL
jgi:hypothetical protein